MSSTIKQKEQRLEQDFSKLMERYNRSKNLINSYYTSHVVSSDLPQKSEQNQVTLDSQDTLHKEKYKGVKMLNKELKSTLKEYVTRQSEIEVGQESKELLIAEYKNEIEETQTSLLKCMQEIQHLTMREESLLDQNHLLQEELNTHKTKLARKQQKIKLITDQRRKGDISIDEKTQIFDAELQRIQLLCEDFSLEIKEAEKKNLLLKEENGILQGEVKHFQLLAKSLDASVYDYKMKDANQQQRLEVEQEENKQLSLKVEALERKLDEQREQMHSLESKSTKHKQKLEEQQNTTLKQQEDKIKQKKQKIKLQTDTITDFEVKLVMQDKDLTRLRKILEESDAEITKLKQMLSAARMENDSLGEELSLDGKKLKQFEIDYDALQQKYFQLEDKLRYELSVKAKQEKHNQSILEEVELLSSENQNYKNQMFDLESQFEHRKRHQNEEMMHIENKIDSLANEAQMLREENADLKLRNSDLKKVASSRDDQISSTKAKYIKAKQLAKQFESQLKNIEEKVRLYELERNNDERDLLQIKQQQVHQKQNQLNKVKILDEIQHMIKHHKTQQGFTN